MAIKLEALKNIIQQEADLPVFTMMEIGAVPLEGEPEPFMEILDLFPNSKLISFEVDEKLCEELNSKARTGQTFYAQALGITEETRPFYITERPMCCSLYKPNEELIKLYTNLHMMSLKSEEEIDTISLDTFMKREQFNDLDFIKIDVQGAELDIFKGGIKALKNTMAIVSEVEFIPLYIDQPLFHDVSSFLQKQEFMLQTLVGIGGRTLKPIFANNDPNFVSQFMWSDALYIKDVMKLPEASPEKLLKLAVIATAYGSSDTAFYCLKQHDELKGTELQKAFFTM